MFDPKTTFEASASALTLLNTLIKTTEKMRAEESVYTSCYTNYGRW
jgi:hypothetical protein